jgi:hypothetical protein
MSRRLVMIVGLFALSLLVAAPAAAQSPPAEEMAAARELVTTIKLGDQFKTMLPILFKGLGSAMIAGRSPEFVRDFEASVPALMALFESRSDEFVDVMAKVYAVNFTAQELRDMTTFYRTPTGQKVLQRLPTVMQQSMQLGQAWGLKLGEEIKQRLIEEMRKKGHDI